MNKYWKIDDSYLLIHLTCLICNEEPYIIFAPQYPDLIKKDKYKICPKCKANLKVFNYIPQCIRWKDYPSKK